MEYGFRILCEAILTEPAVQASSMKEECFTLRQQVEEFKKGKEVFMKEIEQKQSSIDQVSCLNQNFYPLKQARRLVFFFLCAAIARIHGMVVLVTFLVYSPNLGLPSAELSSVI